MEGLVVKNQVNVDVVKEGSGSVEEGTLELHTHESSTISEDESNDRFSSLASRPFVWHANNKPQSAKYFSPNSDGESEGIPLKIKEKWRKPISESDLAEIAMVKERLSKLLLGEDMSGSGNGVQTALALSNAITNLCASVFGELRRLEPLSQIKKSMWKREMDCLLCVTDYIVVLSPSWHIYPDGSKVEIMSTGPRSDLAANLPALRKLDSMLLEILDCFTDTEFWYVDKGLSNPEVDDDVVSLSSKSLQGLEEKWWLPVPQVPSCGLSKDTRKMLENKRDCGKQILKAVTAINNMTLADMEVPEFFYDGLPKHARDCLGEKMYRYLASQRFSAERLVAALGIKSDHQALEIANQVEAAIFVFRKRTHVRDTRKMSHNSKHSWELVKDFAIDGPKMDLLAGRAESLLLSLKQRFPGLPQTTLDTIKIQHNRDIGKSILESYSRVLESLAFNIIGRIDDVLSTDDLARQSDQKIDSFVSKICSVGRITPSNKTSARTPNPDDNKALVKKITLMSHIPTLQTSTCGDFEI